jgi:MFS family permease
MTSASDATRPRASSAVLVVAASSIGTVFEWYDFFVFGSLAAIIGKHFYSNVGEAQGFLFALLTFGAGFAARPFGALVFGHVGDRIGRKGAFLATVTIMGLATFAIGLLPDYATLGATAAYILIALRILQGFAVGGEYGGAATYVAEHAKPDARGFATGWIQVSASIGLFLALGVILAIRMSMGEGVFAAWAWRIPFLLSVILLGVSLWMRLRLDESPLFRQMQTEGRVSRAPLSEAFLRWSSLRTVLIVLVGLLMAQGVVWYTAEFYTLFFLQNVIKAAAPVANLLVLVATAAGIPLHVFFGWLSDRVGRKPVMLFGIALAIVAIFPGFRLLTSAVNPALASASQKSPVIVAADPADCSFQFDLIGKTKFVSSCDIAKSALANAGVPYRNQPAPAGATAEISVGAARIMSFNGRALDAKTLAATRAAFDAVLKRALVTAGYPPSAETAAINVPLALAVLIVLITAAAALYGPQAAALVELFPTRIRYSALSLPYHIGVGWFGGFLPATAFAIVAATGDIYAGLWYPFAIAALAFIVSLIWLPETRGRDIAAATPA